MKNCISVFILLMCLTACKQQQTYTPQQADTTVCIAPFSTPELPVKLVCIISNNDTFRVQQYIDEQLVLDLDYQQQYATQFSALAVTPNPSFQAFKQRFNSYTFKFYHAEDVCEIEEYSNGKPHGKYQFVNRGVVTTEGYMFHGKRRGLWKECETIPEMNCEQRIYITREWSPTIPMFLSLIIALIELGIGIYLVIKWLKTKETKFIFNKVIMLVVWIITCIIINDIKSMIPFLVLDIFFTIPVILLGNMVFNTTTTTTKIVSCLIVLFQLLVVLFWIALINTDFSH